MVDVCREHQISEHTFHRWKREFEMLEVDQTKQPNAWLAKLKTALRRLSNAYPMWGYPKITRLLQEDGWKVCCCRVQRLRRELGLMVSTKEPRR